MKIKQLLMCLLTIVLEKKFLIGPVMQQNISKNFENK